MCFSAKDFRTLKTVSMTENKFEPEQLKKFDNNGDQQKKGDSVHQIAKNYMISHS
jgi:hypothetical protein